LIKPCPESGELSPYKIEDLMPDIRKAVYLACILHKHQVSREDAEDFCQQIMFLLVEDDYRRLRSFNERSSFNTWLNTVARHHLSRHLRLEKRAQSLEEISLDLFIYEPAQEERIIYAERRELLQNALSRISKRQRQLYELLCRDELTSSDIAGLMGIEAGSIRRRKHALIKELRKILGCGPGEKIT
jgi:RNA polymerase sigma factor (sigma-70 family)